MVVSPFSLATRSLTFFDPWVGAEAASFADRLRSHWADEIPTGAAERERPPLRRPWWRWIHVRSRPPARHRPASAPRRPLLFGCPCSSAVGWWRDGSALARGKAWPGAPSPHRRSP